MTDDSGVLTGGICVRGRRYRTREGWKRTIGASHTGPRIGEIGDCPVARCTRCGAIFTIAQPGDAPYVDTVAHPGDAWE